MPISHSPSRRAPGVATALAPAEALGAGAPGLDDVARGEAAGRRSGPCSGSLRRRSSIGSMPSSCGELVDRAFEREGADRLAGRAHEGVGQHVERRPCSTSSLKAAGGIGAARRQDERLRHGVVRRHRRRRRCGSARRSVPSGSRAERDALLGQRASADDAVDALARQHEPHRPAGELRGGRGEDLVLPQRLAAEAAADEGRGDVRPAPRRCRRSAPATRRCASTTCVASWTTQRRRPPRRAVTACSSMALWLWRGVR